ncbi:MAG: protein kinase [Kofleriaceae bacterium]|nr:protein kinase [Kofleriaceae bacterium]
MIEGAPGRFVGDRYHIVRELGRGGMGVVYLGRDLRLDMDVAIKFRGVSHSDATLWLKREFRVVASLRHPQLVELYELVAHDKSCYFTMEYLHGVDPRRWVERSGAAETRAGFEEANTALGPAPHVPAMHDVFARPVPAVDFHRVRSVVGQLAEGLAFLHARGVIHRDVKPTNVIVVDDRHVKLLDFGLALGDRREELLAKETRIVGTAAYLAPEYLERLVVGTPLDVYALGVLGYELCTGTPPFGGTMHVLARLQQHLEVPRASSINPDVPRDLDTLIASMLAADPADRPSAHDVATRLLGTQSRPRNAPPLRFVGREGELDHLAHRIADPTPRARLVILTGPSGVGKTALIDETLGRVRAGREEALSWRGRCDERERVPYRAFDSIVDDLATELAGAPWLAKEIEHVAALIRVFPVLAPLIDPSPAEAPPAADLRVERERALLALARMFESSLSAPRGVIAIDDLQWADDDSLELLALLVERVTRPLTVLASWTTDAAPGPRFEALLTRLGAAVEVLDLGAMTDEQLARVIGELAPRAPANRLTSAARLAAGSPSLAELIGRELGEADIADPREAEIRRLERLSRDERTVAEIASLASGAASFAQLRAVAELSSERLQSVLRGLELARIVRVTPAISGEPGYAFYHQRLRDTAHASMPDATRRARHERFAAWFEGQTGDPAQLAYHWREAGETRRAQAAAIAAGDAAQAQLAWGLAADWFERARELGATNERVRERLAECLFLGGKLAPAALEFLALARDADAAVPAPTRHRGVPVAGDRWRVRAAEAYLKLGELERGLAVLDEVLAHYGEKRAQLRALSVARAAAVGARWMLPFPGGKQASDGVLAAAYRVIASFLSTPYPVESLEYVLRGVALAERSGDRAGHALGMAMLAAYLAAGTLGRYGDRAIATAHRLGLASGAPYARMVAAGAAGLLATVRGEWDGMRAAHEDAEHVCRRLGLERSWEASFLRSYRALGEIYAGEPLRALEVLETLDHTSEDLWTRAMLGSWRGRALVLAGRLEDARQLATRLARTPAAHQGMASIYRQVFLGELALAERDWGRALTTARELHADSRAQWVLAMPAISAMIDVITATAELGRAVASHGRDREAAVRARTTARALYRRGRSSFYAPTALRLWSQADAVLGEHAASREILMRAAPLAERRGSLVDRLAIRALAGNPIAPGTLGLAVAWNTGGIVDQQ